jgi:WD40 repeat protein
MDSDEQNDLPRDRRLPNASTQTFLRAVIIVTCLGLIALAWLLRYGHWLEPEGEFFQIPSPPRTYVEPDEPMVYDLAFSPDGKTVASVRSDGSVRFFDVGSGREHSAVVDEVAQLISICFFPDGRRLLAGSRDGRIFLWDLAREKVERVLPGTGPVTVLSLSEDGKVVSARCACPEASPPAETGQVWQWEVASGQPRTGFPWKGEQYSTVAFAPDGEKVAAVSKRADAQGGGLVLTLWDARNAKPLWSVTHQDKYGSPRAPVFTPDGSLVLLRAGLTLWIFEVATAHERPARTLDEQYGLLFSPDGRTVAAEAWRGGTSEANTRLNVFDWASASRRGSLDLDAPSTALAFSPSGARLAVASRGRIRIWRVPDPKQRETPK